MKGIFQHLGGRGVMITSRIGGLRYGDEDGNENPVISNVLGNSKGKFTRTPWQPLLDRSGILQPELMLSWLIKEF